MATLRQKALIKKISENIRNPEFKKTFQDLMVESGFSLSTAKRGQIVLKEKGVQELLIKAGIRNEDIIGEWQEMAFNLKPQDRFKYESKIKALDKLTELAGLNQETGRGRITKKIEFIKQFYQPAGK